jgi:hypothetical protein
LLKHWLQSTNKLRIRAKLTILAVIAGVLATAANVEAGKPPVRHSLTDAIVRARCTVRSGGVVEIRDAVLRSGGNVAVSITLSQKNGPAEYYLAQVSKLVIGASKGAGVYAAELWVAGEGGPQSGQLRVGGGGTKVPVLMLTSHAGAQPSIPLERCRQVDFMALPL